MTENAQKLSEIAKLVFAFAKINRSTFHDDGVSPESDTDHTVMLIICACALAQKFYPDLNCGKIAEFATVHDLTEALVGDTSTFNISPEDRKKKEAREHEAFKEIKRQFMGTYSWMHETIALYDSQATPEARYVKLVDKLMTKLTHSLNRAAYMRKNNVSAEETERHFNSQYEDLKQKYGDEFPQIIALIREFTEEVYRELYNKQLHGI